MKSAKAPVKNQGEAKVKAEAGDSRPGCEKKGLSSRSLRRLGSPTKNG